MNQKLRSVGRNDKWRELARGDSPGRAEDPKSEIGREGGIPNSSFLIPHSKPPRLTTRDDYVGSHGSTTRSSLCSSTPATFQRSSSARRVSTPLYICCR